MKKGQDLYSQFVKNVKLEDIVLDSIHAEVNREAFEEKVKPKVTLDETLDVRKSPDELNFEVSHKLIFKATVKRKLFVKIVLKFSASYSVSDRIYFTDEHVILFAETSSRLHIWPYTRETLHNLLTRMGLPPFVLPLVPILPEGE